MEEKYYDTDKNNPRDLTVMALFAALLCVSSYISIPLPFSAVSLTLQTLIINMIAILLPPKKAGLTVLVWMLLGLAGLPVFSGGMGGAGKIVRTYRGLYFRISGGGDSAVVIKRQEGEYRQRTGGDHCRRNAFDLSDRNSLDDGCHRYRLEGGAAYRSGAFPAGGCGKVHRSGFDMQAAEKSVME